MRQTLPSKKLLMTQLITALLLSASAASAGNVGVDLNIHLGTPPQRTIVLEPLPPPEQDIDISGDIQFIFPDALGFYVAIGVPYDLFYQQNNYYLFRDGHWFRSSRSQGPWHRLKHRDLPPGLRKHRIERIRNYRDTEYGIYRRDQDHYRGRHFRPDKEEQRELKREEKEQRREDKEYRREDKKRDKEERAHGRGRD